MDLYKKKIVLENVLVKYPTYIYQTIIQEQTAKVIQQFLEGYQVQGLSVALIQSLDLSHTAVCGGGAKVKVNVRNNRSWTRWNNLL